MSQATNIPQIIEQRNMLMRKVFHKHSFESFQLFVLGTLLNVTRPGLVRASLLSQEPFNWRRLHDFIRRNRWSHQKLIATNCELALENVVEGILPRRLFWVVDSTSTDKAYAKKIYGVRIVKRSSVRFGERSTHQGHRWMLLSLARQDGALQYKSCLIGALLSRPGNSDTELAARLVTHARLPRGTRNIVAADRGFGSIKLTKKLASKGIYVLVRMKKNEKLYSCQAPEKKGARGRPLLWGKGCRVDGFDQWEGSEVVRTRVHGKRKNVRVHWAFVRRRGLKQHVKVFKVELTKGKPLFLQSSDLTLPSGEAVWGYLKRHSIEPAIEDAKELGLGHYKGRKAKGVSRWGTLICVVHNLLQSLYKEERLPSLNWPWYEKENTTGALQRRLQTLLMEAGVLKGFSQPIQRVEEAIEKPVGFV